MSINTKDISQETLESWSDEDLNLFLSGDYASMSSEALSSILQPTDPNAQKDYSDSSWGEVALGAVKNTPGSTWELAKGVTHAVVNPIDTGMMLLKIVGGGVQHGLDKVDPRIMEFLDDEGNYAESKEIARRVGEFYQNRYKDEAAFKNALANDPAGVLADAATIFYGSGALLKAGKLEKVGTGVTSVGKAIDPINLSIKASGLIGKKTIGPVGQSLVSTMTGGQYSALSEARRAGLTGGTILNDFTKNLRDTKMNEVGNVVDIARANLQLLKDKRANDYVQGMEKINKDPTILSFEKVDNAILNAMDEFSPKGIILDDKGMAVLKKIQKIVDEFKNSDNPLNQTASGIDDMKQKIWNETSKLDKQKYPNAVRVLDNIYHETKATIIEQAPEYAKVMEDYSSASDLLNQIERTLSLKGNAMPDATLRKLQSLMNNNVNTNYGARLTLADELNKIEGATDIMPILAGQSLNKLTPRGIQGATSPIAAMAAFHEGGIPAAIATGVISSPRIMGEAFRSGGILERYVKNSGLGPNSGGILNMMYQADRERE